MADQNDENYKQFIEFLHRGSLLLELKEFDDFHFAINVKDKEIVELVTLLSNEGINEKNYFERIEPKAASILKISFTQDKEKEVYSILEVIEKGYTDNKEICATTYASKLFLENQETEHHRLPLAITRLLEDAYVAFSKAAG